MIRVLMISKALVVGAYQRKLEEIAKHDDIELTAVIPSTWAGQPYRAAFTDGYRTLVRPIVLDGRFHLFTLPSLGTIIRTLRPDVVHIDEEPYNLMTALALRDARAVGARTAIFTWQNLLRRYPPPFSWLERYVLGRVDGAIAGNAEAVEVLRAKGCTAPATVIPQFGIDPDLFSPDPEMGSTNGPAARPFTIGFVGRLTPEKGLDVLLDAASRLTGDWRLRLIGDGPLRSALASAAQRPELAGRVTVEAGVSSLDVPARLRELDVLVLPSLTRPNWKEQFGRVLVEAMACAVPVVGSDSGEIPRVIGDGGAIVPEGDAEALADALRALQADVSHRRTLGRRGRQRALAHFTHARIASETVAFYRRIAAEPPAGRRLRLPGRY